MMCANLWRLADEVKELEGAGVDLLHFDLMDAHYVPNMPVGLGLLEQLSTHTQLPFDIHLMVDNPDFFVEKLVPIGVQQISVHPESAPHLDRTLSIVRAHGIKAGVALNPSTPLSALTYAVERLDYVVIMTVNPGWAAQQLVPSGMRKIADCRAFLEQSGCGAPIEVDGNVSFEHIPAMVAAGADILVGGTSSVFHKGHSLSENVRQVRQAIERGLLLRTGQPEL
jgi:ribulose-phosphate 3-epimerase